MQNSKDNQKFLEEKYEEGLKTIRSRISALSQSQYGSAETKSSPPFNSLMGETIHRKSSVSFSGKLDNLSDQLSLL